MKKLFTLLFLFSVVLSLQVQANEDLAAGECINKPDTSRFSGNLKTGETDEIKDETGTDIEV